MAILWLSTNLGRQLSQDANPNNRDKKKRVFEIASFFKLKQLSDPEIAQRILSHDNDRCVELQLFLWPHGMGDMWGPILDLNPIFARSVSTDTSLVLYCLASLETVP